MTNACTLHKSHNAPSRSNTSAARRPAEMPSTYSAYPKWVARLHVQHISERAFVADLIGERAGLVEHLLRLRVITPKADRPSHCAEQPRLIGAGDVTQGAKPALGRLNSFHDPSSPGQLG